MVVVKQIHSRPQKRIKSKSMSAFVAANSQGMKEGQKSQQMKLEGPQKDFKSVQDWEQQLIQSEDPSYRLNLQNLVWIYRDAFLENLPKGHPQKGTLSI